MDKKSSTSSKSPGDVEGEPVAKKIKVVYKTIIYDESVANQCTGLVSIRRRRWSSKPTSFCSPEVPH